MGIESGRYERDRIKNPIEQVDASKGERRIRDAGSVNDNLNGTTTVPLDQINPTEIKTANDFNDPEKYAALKREATMLKQMQPALAQGGNADTFDAWDKQWQIGNYSPSGHTRGYNDVYHSYYGAEKIALEAKPNGTYDVLNGRHRIVAARDAGLATIPAYVQG